MANSIQSGSAARPPTEMSNLRFALVISIPVLLFLLVVVAYPLAYALYLSFNDVQFFGGYSADWVGLKNYAVVLSDASFWSSLRLTLQFTAETIVLTILVGMGLALILRRLPLGWRWLRALIILPWAVSPYGAGIFFGNLGRGQTGVGTAIANMFSPGATANLITANFIIEYLAVGAAWNIAPLVAFFLLANMLTIPPRLYDLAKIDQMSPFETFWHVTLPPLRFTIFVFTCITAVLAMKTFDYIFTETQGGPGSASSVLTYTLYKISFVDLNLGYGAAMSFFLLAVILGCTAALYLLWGRREERR
jgi:multiple sugar transport system permease protein